MKDIHVLFVCLGNICRSPMAEGAFLEHIATLGLQHRLHVDSCGTGNWHRGELADPRMRQTAEQHGILLTHRARQLRTDDFIRFNYILCMDNQNLQDVQHQARKAPSVQAEVALLRSYDTIGKGTEVADPYYGTAADFELCYQTVHRATRLLLQALIQRHQLIP